ncbi:MAG: NuoM family protein [Bacteroidota bacterium]
MEQHILSIITFLPLLSALLMLAIPRANTGQFRTVALLFNGLSLALLAMLYGAYTGSDGVFTGEVRAPWFSVTAGGGTVFSAGYHLTVDGLSLPLMMLTGIVMFIATLASSNIEQQVKGFFILMQVLYTAILGTFAAADMLLFYLFFEFMLVPMYFLIGIWGGARREYAAVKFFLYTLAGSIFILIGMIVLYVSVGTPGENGGYVHTFDLDALTALRGLIPGSVLDPSQGFQMMGLSAGWWVMVLILTGFAIKVPIVPLHTWLPDAHVEAPTPVSIVLAALLLKTGAYGIIRFGFMILPSEVPAFRVILAGAGVLSIIYGALNALASGDLKRMIAYSSVSHMGFVMLGIAAGTAAALQGAIFQLISHGLISAMLFAIAGMLQSRTGDRTIGNYSGLFQVMPTYASIMMVAFFAGMGMPGFSSFIGEVLVLLGAYRAGNLQLWLPVAATVGIILSAGYFLWTIQRMLFGTFSSTAQGPLTDLSRSELYVLVPLALLTILLGVYPAPLLDLISGFTLTWSSVFPASPTP